ncbi:MAG: ATP-dependent DNA helicase RecG [Bacillota bacterium]
MLEELKGVGAVTLSKLHNLGIYSVEDLANFLPFKYMDFDALGNLSEAQDGDTIIIKLEIISASRPFRRGKFVMFSAHGKTEEGAVVKLVWYNSSFVSKLVVVGAKIRCYGKVRTIKGYEITNAVYEVSEEGKATNFVGIKPIYATKGHIPQSTALTITSSMLKTLKLESFIPADLANKYNLIELNEAYNFAHRPKMMIDAEVARNRITLENVVKRICAYRVLRECTKRQVYYKDKRDAVLALIAKLPYTLSESQQCAINEIMDKLLSNNPLNAMIIGDVGCGKTIVALLSAYFAVKSGKQVAIMAPTEILARQHFNNFTQILDELGIRVSLLIGGLDAKTKNAVRSAVKCGDVDIVIGTHALVTKYSDFYNLSLMIVDEQHKFGVATRTALMDKGKNIDIITLSATPIPRSLRLTMFGDIDVINIDRRYNSNNIKTAIVKAEKRDDMFKYIVSECKKGKQAYIVAPSILDDEGKTMEATETVFSELQELYGKEVNIVQLHGKMTNKDKNDAMAQFSSGKASILISTTVIEVGVDVPHASLMAILDADRFGLATLHQLRGRIGRDGGGAFCFLHTTKKLENEILRLTTLVNEQDGAKIAERDYELRGAGEWLGANQSGSDCSGISLTIQSMKKAKAIADCIDTTNNQKELLAYAEALNLQKISLT